MAFWTDGIDHPTQDQFKEHERILRKYTVLVPDDDFEPANAFDVLEDVLCSANTVQNYYRQLLKGGGSKRRRDDADAPDISDNEDTRRTSKAPQETANKKRSRSVDRSDNENKSRSSKMPRIMANKKRSRGAVDTSEDEGKSKPSKKARFGTQEVDTTQAVKELQNIFKSSAKGSK